MTESIPSDLEGFEELRRRHRDGDEVVGRLPSREFAGEGSLSLKPILHIPDLKVTDRSKLLTVLNGTIYNSWLVITNREGDDMWVGQKPWSSVSHCHIILSTRSVGSVNHGHWISQG